MPTLTSNEIPLMVNLSDKVCCCIDFGNYICVAQRLARDFSKVYYYAPFVINGFPEHNPKDIGRGVPEIVKITEWEPFFEEIDIFVFPDLYFSGLQSFLSRIGKLVFGSGQGQIMETDRGFMKRIQKELGLPTNDYDEVEGLYELEANLMFAENKYVKSELRGDNETFHHKNYTTSKEEIKNMKQRMGIYDKKEKYIVESSIDAIAEVGIDTCVISGSYLPESLSGIELKDVGYYGKIVPYKSLPSQIKDVTDSLAPIFQSYEYKGAYSNEIRIDKNKKGYLIDSTTRFPLPPTTLMMAMYDNFSEVIWYVANGIVPIVKYKYQHGVEFIMKSESAKTQPLAIQFPSEFKNHISIKNLVVDDDGTYHYTPNGVPVKEVGSVVGFGNSMEQACKMATEIAKTVKGFDLTINTNCIDDAKSQLKKLRENGINYL